MISLITGIVIALELKNLVYFGRTDNGTTGYEGGCTI